MKNYYIKGKIDSTSVIVSDFKGFALEKAVSMGHQLKVIGKGLCIDPYILHSLNFFMNFCI